jgi:predicted acylesterase/phospholipase RssA/CRP-like cAMP-binding protein
VRCSRRWGQLLVTFTVPDRLSSHPEVRPAGHAWAYIVERRSWIPDRICVYPRSQMSIDNLIALLGASPGFSAMPSETRRRVASLFKEQNLAAGEVLARQGDPGDTLFLVVEGSIGLSTRENDPAATIRQEVAGPGAVTGERALLSGHPRGATMTAQESSVVATLSRADFDQLCLDFPQDMDRLVAWMRGRLHSYQIKKAISDSPLFKDLSETAKLELKTSFAWSVLRSGETLFRKGDPGDTLYLIVSGRIQLFQEANNGACFTAASEPLPGEQLLTELGPGDTLGEMALLTGEARSATAYAVRDSQLARLDRASFRRIIAAFPHEILGLFVHQMAERLREQNRGRKPQGRPPVSIAVLVFSPLAQEFADQLAKALSSFGATLHLTRSRMSAFSSDQPIAADAAETRLLAWLSEQETHYNHVVYEADAVEDPWTFRCLRQADVLFAAADAKEEPLVIAARLQSLLQRAERRMVATLVLFHVSSTAAPTGTKLWLSATGANRHWHVRDGCIDDVSRIARFLTGRSIGLALGGGFAFGLAHIGVIQALREMNVPIDYVGGTSMGAIIAVACASHFSRSQMLEIMDKGCAQSLKGDFTIPIVSLMTGRNVGQAIGSYLNDRDIEDLWLPYFSISASLVHARMVVHTRGNALRSVLASCRVPGIFPPLGWDDEVLVDGGLVNNLPSDVMRGEVGSGTVIAAQVSPAEDFSVQDQFDLHLSGGRVLWRKLNPFAGKRKSITIFGIFARIARLGGVAQFRQTRASADLYLSPPLERFTYRDFSRGEEIAKAGYDYTLREMQQCIAARGRPWEGDAALDP